MDPGTGRRWPTCRRFLDDLYVHTQAVPAADWRAWAETDAFLGGLRRRWAALGIARAEAERLLAEALADPAWMPLAALDATTRMLTALVRGGGLRRGQQVTRALATFLPAPLRTIRPRPLRCRRPTGRCARRLCGRYADRAGMRRRPGACLRAAGVFPAPVVDDPAASQAAPPQLSPDLVAALEEPRVGQDGTCCACCAPMGCCLPTLGLGMGLAAGGVLVEALLWRGLVDLTRHLGAVEQRLGRSWRSSSL